MLRLRAGGAATFLDDVVQLDAATGAHSLHIIISVAAALYFAPHSTIITLAAASQALPCASAMIAAPFVPPFPFRALPANHPLRLLRDLTNWVGSSIVLLVRRAPAQMVNHALLAVGGVVQWSAMIDAGRDPSVAPAPLAPARFRAYTNINGLLHEVALGVVMGTVHANIAAAGDWFWYTGGVPGISGDSLLFIFGLTEDAAIPSFNTRDVFAGIMNNIPRVARKPVGVIYNFPVPPAPPPPIIGHIGPAPLIFAAGALAHHMWRAVQLREAAHLQASIGANAVLSTSCIWAYCLRATFRHYLSAPISAPFLGLNLAFNGMQHFNNVFIEIMAHLPLAGAGARLPWLPLQIPGMGPFSFDFDRHFLDTLPMLYIGFFLADGEKWSPNVIHIGLDHGPTQLWALLPTSAFVFFAALARLGGLLAFGKVRVTGGRYLRCIKFSTCARDSVSGQVMEGRGIFANPFKFLVRYFCGVGGTAAARRVLAGLTRAWLFGVGSTDVQRAAILSGITWGDGSIRLQDLFRQLLAGNLFVGPGNPPLVAWGDVRRPRALAFTQSRDKRRNGEAACDILFPHLFPQT